MLVAVAQLCSKPAFSRNLKICRGIIQRAAKAGAKLVYLPEASDFIAPSTEVYSLATPLATNPFVDGIKEEAKRRSVWVGVGIHQRLVSPMLSHARVYNTHLMIDPDGEVKARYDKLHLFDVDLKASGGPTLLESGTTVPGNYLVPPIQTTVGKVGLLTCYDVRFPEVSLLLREMGADILTYPSAFTIKTGQAHWETLLRARAVETQSYVLAPAQVGEHFPGRLSYGRAMVIDPWGSIIAQCADHTSTQNDEDGTFELADIDLTFINRIRNEMPLWQQRRSDIYQMVQTFKSEKENSGPQ
ncbi:putative NIT2-nitrilase [Serendipita vermifera]|nr:putative NIT2-nitrilase [Serendipita vermifera]